MSCYQTGRAGPSARTSLHCRVSAKPRGGAEHYQYWALISGRADPGVTRGERVWIISAKTFDQGVNLSGSQGVLPMSAHKGMM